jgi:hypothetical protein
MPGTSNPMVWLPEVRVCAEPGPKEESDRADRWQNPTRLWPLRGIKGLVRIVSKSSTF